MNYEIPLIHQRNIHHLHQAYNKNVQHYNLRSSSRKLDVGQQIFVRNFGRSSAVDKFNAKLAPKFQKAFVRLPHGQVSYEL